jgi:hypothetical protein
MSSRLKIPLLARIEIVRPSGCVEHARPPDHAHDVTVFRRTSMRDLLPAAETLAKGVKHIACYVADAIAERRRAFDEDESGDYLRCAGADALAESLGRMESEGPDAADSWHWCAEHNMRTIRCVNMPHAEGDEWNDEPSVCYFCDRPTDRTVVCTADFDTEYVCEKCAHIAQFPAAHGVAADAESLAPKPQGDGSGSEEIGAFPRVPSEPHLTRKTDVCKHCARPIELVIDSHPQYGRAGVWLHVGGDGRCRSTYASPK